MHHFSQLFKLLLISVCFLSHSGIFADEVPAPMGDYFNFGESVKAQVIIVNHDEEFLQLQNKILKKRSEDAKVFDEIYKGHDPGLPYPYSATMGLTEEEHAAYLKAWTKRKIQPLAGVVLKLEKGEGNRHRLHVQGDPRVAAKFVPSGVASLHFNANTGKVETLLGEMERIADINTAKNSVLGPWAGVEWRGTSSDVLMTVYENLVIGERTDSAFCYLIYRKRELESDGRPVADQTLLLRFLPKSKRQPAK